MTLSRSELPFAALLAYSPRGDSEDAKRSRALMNQVKRNSVLRSPGVPVASALAKRMREREGDIDFIAGFLSPTTTLVPVPRSSLQEQGALWPANELAMALRHEGFGRDVLPCLKRTRAVPKAATAQAKDRPRAREHAQSLDVLEPMTLPAEVTFVDDVITRGAQMMGAALAIWAVRPDISIKAFAFLRTISDPEDFEVIFSPCIGIVKERRGECFRAP